MSRGLGDVYKRQSLSRQPTENFIAKPSGGVVSMREYELIAGLETHIELSTKTKIFCSCTTAFGGEPNTHCCPICIGLPGTLPKLNRQAVRYGILAGLATNCTINPVSKMDRKNYVYPDLPKAYQVSQYDKPLCSDGYILLDSGRKIRLTRIHIEAVSYTHLTLPTTRSV